MGEAAIPEAKVTFVSKTEDRIVSITFNNGVLEVLFNDESIAVCPDVPHEVYRSLSVIAQTTDLIGHDVLLDAVARTLAEYEHITL